MKQPIKRCLALLMCMVMLFAALPLSALAAPNANIPKEMLDNVFLDALAYTGYDVAAQKKDGTIFVKYSSATPDAVLSNIGYGTGPTGFETVNDSSTVSGKAPNIAKFEAGGLCCATYISYVYYNYLPNIAGIDTSSASRPSNASSASSYNTEVEEWIKNGVARKISFTQDADGTNFKPAEAIPLGSLLIFKAISTGVVVHVGIYAGYYNGQHFISHVGNDHGPELCTVDGMTKGGFPEAVAKVITPSFVEENGVIEVNKKDPDGKALAGAYFTATSKTDSSVKFVIGPTNSKGYAFVEGVPYDTYKVVETVFPTNYRSYGDSEWTVTVSSKNDGVITVNAVNELIPGSCEIVKTAEDGIVNNVSFQITGNGINKTVTTDTNGKIKTNLKPGTYTITETTIDRYEPQESRSITVVSGKTTTVTFNNTLKRGDLKVTKTAEDGLVKGLQFKLSGTSLSGHKVEQYAVTNDKGIALFEDILIAGSTPYVLEEVNTPDRYEVPASQKVIVEWNKVINKTFHNTLKRGSLKVTKTSEDGLVAGMRFKLTGTALAGDQVTLYAETDSSGIAMFQDVLISGQAPYVLTEVDTAERYVVPAAQQATVEWNKVTGKTVHNALKRGHLRVIKTAEDNLVSGISFRLSGTALNGDAVNVLATTDQNGVALFENILIGSTYTLEEVNTAIKYVVPDDQDAIVEWNKVSQHRFENRLKKFRISVFKLDSDLVGTPVRSSKEHSIASDVLVEMYGHPYGDTQADASLEGAVYGLYKNGTLVEQYITDRNGYFVTDYYPCGDGYYLQEIRPSKGYLLDPTKYPVECSPSNYTVEFNTEYVNVYEKIIKGQIGLVKHTDNGDTQIETPEVGAEFQVYLQKAGSYKAANDAERDTLVIDEDGFATSKKMPYGTYVVHQTRGWDGRELMKDFTVTIDKDGFVYRFIINNANFTSYVKILKKDSTTSKIIPYAGAGFKLFKPDGTPVTMRYTYPTVTTIDTFYTAADGSLMTPETLPYGKGYSLVEIQAPYGYVLDTTPVYFDISKDTATEDGDLTVVCVDKRDRPQVGTVTVVKRGEVFTSVLHQNSVYQPVYAEKGLAGAQFSMYAAEDVITPDGTLRYAKGDLVDTLITGKDGAAVSGEHYLGKYVLYEKKAPYGMVKNDQPTYVELTYAGQTVSVTATSASITNQRQKITLDLYKAMERDAAFRVGFDGEVTTVQFGLFAAEPLTAADGTVIPTDGLLEQAMCNMNGQVVFTTDVPVGAHLYVREIATHHAYVLSDTKYPVNFLYAGENTAVVVVTVNDGTPINNALLRGCVEGYKIDEDGVAISNVLFGLFAPDTTDFTAENAIMTAMTDKMGMFCFDNLPYGTWLVKELAAPLQYVMADMVFKATITKDGDVISIQAENRYVTGRVQVKKTDADTGEIIHGAKFHIYRDIDGDGLFSASIDTFYGEMTGTESTGLYHLDDLRYGGYFLHEVTAPSGYVANTNYHYFAIQKDGEMITVETAEGKGFENVPCKGKVVMVKTDADTGKPLQGVEFALFNSAGKEIVRGKTDKYGLLTFDNLRFGEYTVREISALSGYLSDDTAHKVSIVENEQIVTLELKNKKQPMLPTSPETGDSTPYGLLLAILIASGSATLAMWLNRHRLFDR